MEWLGDHVRLSEYFPQCEYIERLASRDVARAEAVRFSSQSF
jgi:hypothetical protein